MQNAAAAGHAPPKTEQQGDVDARLGRDLPPAKVSQIPLPRVPIPPELPSWSTASGLVTAFGADPAVHSTARSKISKIHTTVLS